MDQGYNYIRARQNSQTEPEPNQIEQFFLN